MKRVPFKTEITIEFGDTDPARIVYYPNIFHYCHVAMERFVAEALGCSYARMITEKQLGFPTVHAEADFRHPIAYGDILKMEVSVARIGEYSLDLRYTGTNGQQNLFVALVRVVLVDMQTFTKRKLPSAYREALAEYLEQPNA